MRICVIGGTGHISTSIVALLLKQGHEVTCFNRGRSGHVPEGAGWIQGDRRDRAAFEQTMQSRQQCARLSACPTLRAVFHRLHVWDRL
jgi:nucleoside-diphosphate-sugar epimerase